MGIEPHGRELVLEETRIRFVTAEDGRGEGVSGIDFAVRDRKHVERVAAERGLPCSDGHVEVAGVRVRLV
jgi:hypothetical protein